MDGTVISWMRISFLFDLVIRVGRICDTSSGTKSLVKFLEELKKKPEYLTRSRYIGLYKNSSLTNINEQANKNFDNLAGKGKSSYPVSLIDEDIKKTDKRKSLQENPRLQA